MNGQHQDRRPRDHRLVGEGQAAADVGDEPADERGDRRWRCRPSSACPPCACGARGRGPPCRGSAGPCRGCGRSGSGSGCRQRDDHRHRAGDHDGDHGDAASQELAGDDAVVEVGSTASPMVWVVSWPLPAITTTSPGRPPASAAAMARAAVGLDHDGGHGSRRAPRRSTASMIASGSSERGLSEVTTTRRPASAATAPITGRLAAVPVAAAAEHDDHPAGDGRRGAPRRAPSRRPSGVWA